LGRLFARSEVAELGSLMMAVTTAEAEDESAVTRKTWITCH